MNKLAQLQLAKELLAQEYLQKQAALEGMIKEAVSLQWVLEKMKAGVKHRTHIADRLLEAHARALKESSPAENLLGETALDYIARRNSQVRNIRDSLIDPKKRFFRKLLQTPEGADMVTRLIRESEELFRQGIK